MLLRDPSLLEEGCRVLETDLSAGPLGRIDLFGVDRQGAPVLVALAGADADAALLRLLDQSLWIASRLELLARAYAGAGLAAGRPCRGFLVAPSFSPAFLDRLPLLALEVVPCVARGAASLGPDAIFFERAAALFGAAGAPAHGAATHEAAEESLEAEESLVAEAGLDPADSLDPVATLDPESIFYPESVLDPEAALSPEVGIAFDAGRAPKTPAAGGAPDEDDDAVLTLDPAFDADAVPVLPPEPPPGFPDNLRAAEPFETLTAEELEEFDRFERGRHQGEGRSS